jgi:flagellar biosynthesis/type III secretory pathway protein FliH
MPASLRIVRAPDIEARRDATEIVAAARAEADAIRAAALAEAETLRASVRAEAEQRAREDAAALLAKIAAEGERDDARVRDSVESLAMEVVRTVLGREAAAGPEVLRDVTARAVSRVRRARRLLFKVHPDDVETMDRHVRSWLAAGLENAAVAVEGDASVERGFVVVDSDIGRIDARLARQLEAIERALKAGR